MAKIKDIQTSRDLLSYKRLLMTRLEQELVFPETILLKEIYDLQAEWGSIDDRSSKKAKLLRKLREFLLSSAILGSVANHREYTFINLFK